MVEIEIEAGKAIFKVKGWDKLWALKSSLEIPLSHIQDAFPDPALVMELTDSLKLIGTSIPTLFRAGTFYTHGDLVFWDVRHPEQSLVVVLTHEFFKKLIIEVTDPVADAAMIRNAIRMLD